MTAKVDLKVIVLGKEFVGKTALVERYLNDSFTPSNGYQPTIGAAYGARKMTSSSNIPIIMGIWDTAGSERYQSITKMYYRSAQAAILCYDLCDSVSFQHLNYWIDELKNTEPDCMLFLCGCKKDLVDSKEVSRATNVYIVNELAQALNARSFETSSKTSCGISELFQSICDDVTQNPSFISETMKKNILLTNQPTKKRFNPRCAKC